MYQLNDKIKELTPYEPLKGDFKIRLDANESYLHIPDYILEMILASSTLLKTNRYPDPLAAELCADDFISMEFKDGKVFCNVNNIELTEQSL